MKYSAVLGLLGSIVICACAETARAPATASAGVAGRCTGPVTIHDEGDVRSVGSTCRSIDGDLRVVGTDVTNLDGLANVRSVRYLIVAENPKLQNVRGLRGVIAARGVTFMNDPSLESLEGLESVVVSDGVVVVNTGIRSLSGLENLHKARKIVIANNAHLETAGWLTAVDRAADVHIENNGTQVPSVTSQMVPNAATSTDSNASASNGE